MTGGNVAYQGEPGAFGEQACMLFLPDRERIARPTFDDVVQAVLTGEAELGMLPIENNGVGPVPGVERLIRDNPVRVVERVSVPIHLHLVAAPGTRLETVRTVASHSVALAQCRRMIAELALAEEVATNTASAARELAETRDPRKAVLASETAASAYGLIILRRDVHDRPDNVTTFCVVARRDDRDAEG